jgi:general secretion pathway protein K
LNRRQSGAAVVMAMLIVAVSVILVSGAFLRQSAMARQVENEVALGQARRLLEGAIDWIRVILREDARTSAVDHLGEPWAVSLEQTRLDNEGGDPAWISGGIEDAQARYNLRNLSGPTGPVQGEIAVLGRLLEMVGANSNLAEAIALRVDQVVRPANASSGAVLPATLDDIAIEDPAQQDAISRLRPFLTVLPVATPVNANTASAEVLAARFDNLSLSDARRLTASRDRAWFRDMNDFSSRLPGLRLAGGTGQVVFATQFFMVRGYAEFRRVKLQALALLKREGGQVDVLWNREGPG